MRAHRAAHQTLCPRKRSSANLPSFPELMTNHQSSTHHTTFRNVYRGNNRSIRVRDRSKFIRYPGWDRGHRLFWERKKKGAKSFFRGEKKGGRRLFWKKIKRGDDFFLSFTWSKTNQYSLEYGKPMTKRSKTLCEKFYFLNDVTWNQLSKASMMKPIADDRGVRDSQKTKPFVVI